MSLKNKPLFKSRDIVRFPVIPKGWDVVSGLHDAYEAKGLFPYREPAGNGDEWVTLDECPYEGCDDCPYDCDDEFSEAESRDIVRKVTGNHGDEK